MSTNLLRVEPNQRVDYSDFDYLLNESLTAMMRDAGNNFLLNPDGAAAERMRIIDGFEMDSPAGKQLRVTLGRALLAERISGVINYGAIVATGDATQTIDMAPLASNTYGVFIRFEYVDAESGSRVFWNPGGSGSEFTQNISTRRNAAWSMRVELTSPGAEWLQIGTADNSGGSLVIVDQRDLYFEGAINASYESGWSSEGGGVATDRNANRALYGVKDLQTFTAAMRQCLTDIRGRGLREWYEKGIGGLNIGFDTDPEENQLHVGNSDFGLEFDGTDPHLVFDDDRRDEIWFDRSAENYYFKIDAVNRMILADEGLEIANGLLVGTTSGTPYDNDVWVPGGGINCGGSTNPSSGDGIFTRGVKVGNDTGLPKDNCFTAPDGGINCGGSATPGDGDGIFTAGVNVGFDADPTAQRLNVGDASLSLQWVSATDVLLRFDSDDQLRYDRTNDHLHVKINSVDEVRFSSSGVGIGKGLYVGDITGTPTDNDITAQGDIFAGSGVNAGGSSQPGTGDGVFIGGLVVGYDAVPTADQVRIGAETFRLDYNSGAPEVIFDNTLNTKIHMGGAGDLEFLIAGSAEAYVNSSGISIENGLFVGDATIAATDNEIRCQGDLHVGGSTLYFGIGSNDYIDFNDSNNDMIFYIDGTGEARISSNGLNVTNGLYVGNNTTDPTDNDIEAQADIIAGNYLATAARRLVFGAVTGNDYIDYNDTTDTFQFVVDGAVMYSLADTGMTFHGLPLINTGNIDGTGDLTLGTITMTGFSVDADGDTKMRTLDVEHPSTSDSLIAKFHDTRHAAVKDFWVDFATETSTGTEIAIARMTASSLEEILFGTGLRCAFDISMVQYGSSLGTIFNAFRVGEFEGLCYNFGLAAGSQLSAENASVNWVLPNRHMVLSQTSSTSTSTDREVSIAVPPRAGPTQDPVSMINMDNSASSNWVRIGGGMSGENGATAVSIYIATALNSTGALAQSYSSSGLNNCFDRYFSGVAGIQLNNDSSTAGSGTGRLQHSGHRLRFSPGPPLGDIHSTYRSIDSQQNFTSIGVTKVYKYISPWIFNEDLTADGDCVYGMFSGHYTNGASSSMNLGVAYSPDHVGAPTTYQDLLFKGVNLDTAGRFIIEFWITCRTGGNARYVARIQDAGSNQRVEFLTSDIPWDHTKQKRFYMIGQAFGEDRTVQLESGILGVS